MRRPKEELFRKTNDKQLESQTKPEIWLWEIAPGSPSAEDVWHRTCAKGKFEKRGKMEIFKQVKLRVLTMLGRSEPQINA